MSKKNEILDTKSGDLVLDLNSKDVNKTSDGILIMEMNYIPSDNITTSFRIPPEVLEHFKQIARAESAKKKKDINWQRLLVGFGLEKYPIGE